MPEVQNKYGFNTIPLYPMSGRNPVTDKPVTENGPIVLPGLNPEKVTSTEIGYKGLILGKKLFLELMHIIISIRDLKQFRWSLSLPKIPERAKISFTRLISQQTNLLLLLDGQLDWITSYRME